MAEVAEEARDGIYIDGDFYSMDDLTFAEQRKVRQLVNQANAEDEKFDFDKNVALYDLVPAIVTVVKQRENPEFSYAEAEGLTYKDLSPPDEGEGEDPPTPEG